MYNHAFLLSGMVIVGAVLSAQAGSVHAEEAPPRTAFKVCGDPNSLPESNDREEGFENKIAKLFADDLGLPLKYEWLPKRLGFIRHTLKDDDTEDGSYKCDVVMGVVEGFDRTANTQAYYHSTWVMVYVKGRGLDDVKSQQDLANLPAERKNKIRVGLYDRGPGTDWAFKYGLMESMVPYQGMTADPNDHPGRIIVDELVPGKIDLAFVWGPVAGYYARQVKDAEVAVIPMVSEPGFKFDFRFAMGVRFGEKEWKEQLNGLIDKHRDEIKAILAEYGIPAVEDVSGGPGGAKPADNGKK
jgi:quinoprotein dehydrogenase-associated probable ABC transporter substrate-binding protein